MFHPRVVSYFFVASRSHLLFHPTAILHVPPLACLARCLASIFRPRSTSSACGGGGGNGSAPTWSLHPFSVGRSVGRSVSLFVFPLGPFWSGGSPRGRVDPSPLSLLPPSVCGEGVSFSFWERESIPLRTQGDGTGSPFLSPPLIGGRERKGGATIHDRDHTQTTMAPGKMRWGDAADATHANGGANGGHETGNGGSGNDLPPPQTYGPDAKGIKTTVEYRYNEEGQKVKITKKTRVLKKKKVISKDMLARKEWNKFGDAKGITPGTDNLTAVSTDEIFVERPKKLGMKQEEEQVRRTHAPRARCTRPPQRIRGTKRTEEDEKRQEGGGKTRVGSNPRKELTRRTNAPIQRSPNRMHWPHWQEPTRPCSCAASVAKKEIIGPASVPTR